MGRSKSASRRTSENKSSVWRRDSARRTRRALLADGTDVVGETITAPRCGPPSHTSKRSSGPKQNALPREEQFRRQRLLGDLLAAEPRAASSLDSPVLK